MFGGVPFWASNLSAAPYKVVVGTASSKKTFYLHPHPLQQASPFFQGLMNFPGKEQKARTIELPDDDVDAFGLFIAYAYMGSYTLPFFRNRGEKLLLQTKLYILADKLLATQLKLAALGDMVEELADIRLPGQEEETPPEVVAPAAPVFGMRPVATPRGTSGGDPFGSAPPPTGSGTGGAPSGSVPPPAAPPTGGGLSFQSFTTAGATNNSSLFGGRSSTRTGSFGFLGSTASSTASAKNINPANSSLNAADNTAPAPDDVLCYILDVIDALYTHFASDDNRTQRPVSDSEASKSMLYAVSSITGVFGDKKQIFKLGYDPAKFLLARFCASKLTLLKEDADYIQLMTKHSELLQDVLELAIVSDAPAMKAGEHLDKSFVENLMSAAKRGT